MSMAFVFPGQGSQSLGMLKDLASGFPVVRQTFDVASDILGTDMWLLSQEGPETELNRTQNTQPLMLTAGFAVWRVWQECAGPSPVVMAGHSLGEYTALVCAGAMDFEAAVGLVAERARLMQEAVPEGQGAMAAIIGLDDEAVKTACAEASVHGVVEAVNFNAPGQVVIAGEKAAVEAAIERARALGAKRGLLLPVSVPSHCVLMRTAARQMHIKLEAIRVGVPTIPVLHNVDVCSHQEPDVIRSALAAQIHHPVRWVETIQAMAASGVTQVVEIGPGKVLTGLNKRIDKSLDCVCIHDGDSLDQTLKSARSEA